MTRIFRWDAWNSEHARKHGVTHEEAEYVVLNPKPPYPKRTPDEKFLVRGQSAEGRYLQVIYIVDSEEEIEFEDLTISEIYDLSQGELKRMYIIHARPLTPRERANYRKSQ